MQDVYFGTAKTGVLENSSDKTIGGCLKINLRWPLLFHFRLKSFGFFSKKKLTNLLLKISSFQTVFSLP